MYHQAHASSGGIPSRRIADDLRESIHSGQLAPGAEMPSENELAAEYGTSRKTARSALAILRSEGLITTGQGRRAIVRPRGQVGITVTGSNYRKHRSLGLPGFNAQALEQGQRPRQEIREVVHAPAPPEVAMRLDIDEGTEIVVGASPSGWRTSRSRSTTATSRRSSPPGPRLSSRT